MKSKEKKYILASSRPWTSGLAERLIARTKSEFANFTAAPDLTLTKVQSLNPRYIFFPFWSEIIPAELWSNFESVVFHMTDLPYGRGGSPLQNLIARGVYATKICAIRVVKELDAGDVYLRRDLSLHGSAEEIYLRAADIIEGMIEEIVATEPTPLSQEGEPVQFKRRKSEDGNITNLDSLTKVFDYIRMLDAEGYPPAFLTTPNLRFEFSNATRKLDEVQAIVRITRGDK